MTQNNHKVSDDKSKENLKNKPKNTQNVIRTSACDRPSNDSLVPKAESKQWQKTCLATENKIVCLSSSS
jgi:hypothetical protein